MTNLKNGLTSEEVRERKEKGLINGDHDPKTKSVKQIFAHNIFTFFNLINIILAVLIFLVGSPKNAMFALVIVCNTSIGIFQEIRAKRIIDKLTLISSPKAHVIRDGAETEIPTEEIVLDELLIFRRGTQASADCEVAEGECEVNESLITGESDPVTKTAGDKILSGSFVISGEAKAVAVAIGADSFSSKITKGAKYVKKPKSKMMDAINRILKIIAVCIIPIAAVLFYNSIFVSGQDLSRAVTSTVAAIIGMIPEGLVLLSSVVLAVSTIRLAKKKTLVQDLYCIETLARVDVLCLDKTGTITEGNMTAEDVKLLTDKPVDDELCAFVCSLKDDTPTFNAVKERWHNSVNWKAEKTIPFSSAKKWSGVQFEEKGSLILGAAEFILREDFGSIRTETEAFSRKGSRVLLLAHSPEPFRDKDLPQNITPLALISITDKIRPEASEALKYFDSQGVRIMIISGDNPETVSTVAKKAGVKNSGKAVDASAIDNISEAVDKYTVFGRVTPDKKLQIIKALKEKGCTVGMTGDGVNDVLALKEADCSVAMQSGSEAARNVSNLVLLDSNFASMPEIVAEGRRSINNIERSASLFLSKTVYSFLLAVIFLFLQKPFLFEPIQMTLINALCIGAPSFLLALEGNRNAIKGSFIGNVMQKAIPNGLTAVIALSAVMICGHIYGFTTAQISTLATVVLAFVSFMVTCRCCHPLKMWKIMMMTVLMGGFTFGSIFFSKFFAMTLFNDRMIFCCTVICASSVAVIVGLSALVKRIAAHIGKKKGTE